jgi:DNA modification methylase
MQIRKVPISRISPAAYNPRKSLRPEDPEYQRLLKSMNEFGCVEPLVWNQQTGNLVGGHQRFTTLVAQGATSVDVSVVDLPLDKEKALNIALNKIAGQWDNSKLTTLLAELSSGSSLDLGLTGFELPELDGLLDGIGTRDLGAENFDVAAELTRDLPVVTKPGDLIKLGRHRLLCGDAANPECMTRLLGDARARLLCSDPPYNVDYQASRRPKAKKDQAKGSQWSSIRNDALPPDRYAQWFGMVIASVEPYLDPGGPYYLWNGHANFALMHETLTRKGLPPSCVITWAKEHFAPGFGDYQQQTEFCLYGWKRGAKHAWHGGKGQSTIWDVRRDRSGHYQHPTQKSLELFERILRNSSRTGDLVLDPFLGSGTTLIAAARLGRICYGLEIEPKYCDVIVRRFIAGAGEAAVPKEVAERYAPAEEVEG